MDVTIQTSTEFLNEFNETISIEEKDSNDEDLVQTEKGIEGRFLVFFSLFLIFLYSLPIHYLDYDNDENTTIFDDTTKNELINPPVINGIQDFVNNFEQIEKYLHQKPVDKMYEDIIEDFGDPVAAYIPEKVGNLPLKHTVD